MKDRYVIYSLEQLNSDSLINRASGVLGLLTIKRCVKPLSQKALGLKITAKLIEHLTIWLDNEVELVNEEQIAEAFWSGDSSYFTFYVVIGGSTNKIRLSIQQLL